MKCNHISNCITFLVIESVPRICLRKHLQINWKKTLRQTLWQRLRRGNSWEETQRLVRKDAGCSSFLNTELEDQPPLALPAGILSKLVISKQWQEGTNSHSCLAGGTCVGEQKGGGAPVLRVERLRVSPTVRPGSCQPVSSFPSGRGKANYRKA